MFAFAIRNPAKERKATAVYSATNEEDATSRVGTVPYRRETPGAVVNACTTTPTTTSRRLYVTDLCVFPHTLLPKPRMKSAYELSAPNFRAEFLAHYGLLVYIRNQRLYDRITQFTSTGEVSVRSPPSKPSPDVHRSTNFCNGFRMSDSRPADSRQKEKNSTPWSG